MAPTVLGLELESALGAPLGGLEAPPSPEAGGALLAAEPLHAARTTTRAARAARRDKFDMAA
jgi:hypothetical protein